MKVGLIGLGIMGKPMAKNMLKAGYDLTVNDLNEAAVEEVVAAGAKHADNRTIGASCDIVMTMLPNSPQVKAVMLGETCCPGHAARCNLYRHELHQSHGIQRDRSSAGRKGN